VLILDWDIHHGNGTEEIFYDTNEVLYISLHANAYPYTGTRERVGKDKGEGFNVNILLNSPGKGDEDFLLCFTTIVVPILLEYNPELIIISAGYDAAKDDLVGSFGNFNILKI
jgi:histone deacetylase 6